MESHMGSRCVFKVLFCLVNCNKYILVFNLVQEPHPVHLGECGYKSTGHIPCPFQILCLLNTDAGDSRIADQKFIGNSHCNREGFYTARLVAQDRKKIEHILVSEFIVIGSPLLFHKLDRTDRILFVGICLCHSYGHTQRIFLVELQSLLGILDGLVRISVLKRIPSHIGIKDILLARVV